MDSNLINSIGLIFDIIGALMLFKYGLPSDINEKGSINLILEQTDESEIEKWKKYNLFSKIALAFIIIGFIMQLVSNYVS